MQSGGRRRACRRSGSHGLFVKPLLIALQFLTRLPVTTGDWSERDIGRSMLFYPLVGLLLGLALAGVTVALRGGAPGVVAAVLLGMWIFATGALHLDGLADSADAWIGGLRQRAKSSTWPARGMNTLRDFSRSAASSAESSPPCWTRSDTR